LTTTPALSRSSHTLDDRYGRRAASRSTHDAQPPLIAERRSLITERRSLIGVRSSLSGVRSSLSGVRSSLSGVRSSHDCTHSNGVARMRSLVAERRSLITERDGHISEQRTRTFHATIEARGRHAQFRAPPLPLHHILRPRRAHAPKRVRPCSAAIVVTAIAVGSAAA
jgi:hypothetical protein